ISKSPGHLIVPLRTDTGEEDVVKLPLTGAESEVDRHNFVDAELQRMIACPDKTQETHRNPGCAVRIVDQAELKPVDLVGKIHQTDLGTFEVFSGKVQHSRYLRAFHIGCAEVCHP